MRAVLNGSSARAAAARVEFASSTVARWLRHLEEHAELKSKVRPARRSSLDEHAHWLAELRSADPSLSCRAIVERQQAAERGLECTR